MDLGAIGLKLLWAVPEGKKKTKQPRKRGRGGRSSPPASADLAVCGQGRPSSRAIPVARGGTLPDQYARCVTLTPHMQIAAVTVNSTYTVYPGTITSLNKALQCVGDGSLQCDVSCCWINALGADKKSCLTVPL